MEFIFIFLMDNFFEKHGICVKDIPFQMEAASKPTKEDVSIVQDELSKLNFELPDDYIQFCLTYGGGTLGRCKM